MLLTAGFAGVPLGWMRANESGYIHCYPAVVLFWFSRWLYVVIDGNRTRRYPVQ
jgi:hypothetical protein